MEKLHRMLLEKLDTGIDRRSEFGPIWLDIGSRTVQMEGTSRGEKLGDVEYQILWMLMRARGAPVSTEEMAHFIYGARAKAKIIAAAGDIRVYIHKLRPKLHHLTKGAVKLNNTLDRNGSYYLHVG